MAKTGLRQGAASTGNSCAWHSQRAVASAHIPCCVGHWSGPHCFPPCRCAGTCAFSSGAGCVIKLSEPILKLRPPEDLKETLLHEMIHAYVMLQRLPGAGPDGHSGPFLEKMKFINSSTAPDWHRPATGYNISVYHTMHDEVNHYRVHWWQCEKCALRLLLHWICKIASSLPGNHHA